MTLLLSPDRARTRPVFDLATFATRTAVHTEAGETTYAELAERAGDLAHEVLGPTRRLVLIEGANHPDALTAYLAAVQHGHVALLVPDQREQQLDALVATYDPDVVLRREATDWQVNERRDGTAHRMHPDLALLLSTSGSTGSPKLVRLSADNLRSNAESIADYLRITGDDRAATSLPMHYCYGLSVINSHLVSGAGLVLTEGSVVDPCFWELFDRTEATSFAGVPYTFDLLDRSGFHARHLPSLRYVTQAGGRLAPERVQQYVAHGRRDGWDFVVMYGQTEATARMAYLPPELAAARASAIGVAIPGGSFRIEPVTESPDAGELVYTGPNVMLGYAETPADLQLGRTVTELRTGDLAREVDGLYEIVGRRSRHAKLFGLRIDLDRVEAAASDAGPPVRCVVVDDVLHGFTTRRRVSARLRQRLADLCGLPQGAVRVHVLAELPLTANGKPDQAALERAARAESELERRTHEDAVGPVSAESVRDEFAVVLGRPDASVHSTFVGLGGDSLSYVELATRLSRSLGDLPADWHTRSAAELAGAATRSRRGVAVDPTVLLRALAIVAIVGTHANLFTLAGGAHLLLAVAGFNFARFQLADVSRRRRLRNGMVAVAQVVVPSTLFIGGVALVSNFYTPATALFLNQLLGSDDWTRQWQFWFLEALVWISLGVLALLAAPGVDRLERQAPYAFALTLVGALLLVRFAWVGLQAGETGRYTIAVVGWCFAVGWLAARARTVWHQVGVLAATAVGVVGFFGDLERELLILGGIALLTWLPQLRLPRLIEPVLYVLAASSLFVYLTHWVIYPHLEDFSPILATLVSFAVGIGYWQLMRPVGRRLRGVQ